MIDSMVSKALCNLVTLVTPGQKLSHWSHLVRNGHIGHYLGQAPRIPLTYVDMLLYPPNTSMS